MQRQMLSFSRSVAYALAGTIMIGTAVASAQEGKLSAAPPVSYANRYEVYAGFNFMNTQAGQAIPQRTNLGGLEVLGTDWLTPKIGIAADFRAEAGTAQVDASPIEGSGVSRPLIYEFWGMGGIEYRGPKNQHAAINFHGYGGVSSGVFNAGTQGAGPGNQFNATQNAALVGLYANHTAPIFAVGGSLDFNRSKNWAVRLSPDLILEHFGNETREFFSISGGIVYRFPLKKKK